MRPCVDDRGASTRFRTVRRDCRVVTGHEHPGAIGLVFKDLEQARSKCPGFIGDNARRHSPSAGKPQQQLGDRNPGPRKSDPLHLSFQPASCIDPGEYPLMHGDIGRATPWSRQGAVRNSAIAPAALCSTRRRGSLRPDSFPLEPGPRSLRAAVGGRMLAQRPAVALRRARHGVHGGQHLGAAGRGSADGCAHGQAVPLARLAQRVEPVCSTGDRGLRRERQGRRYGASRHTPATRRRQPPSAAAAS